jgi:hypothetical protein
MITRRASGRSRIIRIRTIEDGKPTDIVAIHADSARSREWQRQSIRWQYIVCQRNRWSQTEEGRASVRDSAIRTLRDMGIGARELRRLGKKDSAYDSSDSEARARLIEISIPWTPEGDGDWARRMPWEYLLSAATRDYRTAGRKVIVRRIEARTIGNVESHPHSFCFVEACPISRDDTIDFMRERDLIRSTLAPLAFKDWQQSCGPEPSVEVLARWLQREKPSVVHIAADHSLSSSRYLPSPSIAGKTHLTSDFRRQLISIDVNTLAEVLQEREYHPNLIAFNGWNSGSRLAPMMVAAGSEASLGFESLLDDSMADLFFAHFYSRWREDEWNYGTAFCHALNSVKPYREQVRGSGIILWTRSSLLDSQYRSKVSHASGLKPPSKRVQADPKLDRASSMTHVEVKPWNALNYAILHNGGSLLESLSIRFVPFCRMEDPQTFGASRAEDEDECELDYISEIRDIDVTVTLNAGKENFVYQSRINLTEQERVIDIANTALEANRNHPSGGIFIPLTSDLMRTVDESILTSIHVRVDWHQESLFNRSYPVRLAPIDEWIFDREHIVWMPSFIQPRDVSISKIIDAAQRYLICLSDDPGVGFDGYQAYNPEKKDPWRGVDLQVQAIWMALLLDYPLSYINPPPSYSNNAQRLRMPSQVLGERRGTCIDLALVFAACLEWIDIYPVIFVLQDHALPGYWRNPAAHRSFHQQPEIDFDNGSGSWMMERGGSPMERTVPWYSDASAFHEIRSHILPRRNTSRDVIGHRADHRLDLSQSDLIPLESTLLTRTVSFTEAVEKGKEVFSEAINGDFHSMIDIVTSRRRVTPIPSNSMRFWDT